MGSKQIRCLTADADAPEEFTPSYCYSIIGLLTMLFIYSFIILLVLIWKKIRKAKSKSKLKLNPIVYTLVIMVFGMLCCGSFIQLYATLVYAENYIDHNPSRPLLYVHTLVELTYTLSSYAFIALQLYLSLKGSAFELSNCVVILHIFIFVSLLVLNIFRVFLYATGSIAVAQTVGAASVFFGVCGALHISCMFDAKLFSFIVEHRKADSAIVSATSNMLKVVSRTALLMAFVMTFAAIRTAIGILTAILDTGTMRFVFAYCHGFWVLGTSFCFFLMLAMNGNVYYRLCKKCDVHCMDVCESLARASADKEELKNEDGKDPDKEQANMLEL